MNSFLSLRNLLLAAAVSVSAFADHSAVTPAPRPDQGWETRAAKDVWEKYYGKRKAVNIGIGGDRTQHVLYRLQNGNLEGVKPKAAVVMIGTNNSNGEDNSAQQIAEGVK